MPCALVRYTELYIREFLQFFCVGVHEVVAVRGRVVRAYCSSVAVHDAGYVLETAESLLTNVRAHLLNLRPSLRTPPISGPLADKTSLARSIAAAEHITSSACIA